MRKEGRKEGDPREQRKIQPKVETGPFRKDASGSGATNNWRSFPVDNRTNPQVETGWRRKQQDKKSEKEAKPSREARVFAGRPGNVN